MLGVVETGPGDIVQGVVRSRLRLGNVDDVEGLGTAEAGDLDCAHGVRLWPALR